MARKPTPKAKAPAKPRAAKTPATAVPATASVGAPAPAASAQSVIEDLKDFAVRHRCTLELPEPEALVPGAVVKLRVTGPESAERLVAECRAHALIADVRLLAAHIEIDVAIPAEDAK